MLENFQVKCHPSCDYTYQASRCKDFSAENVEVKQSHQQVLTL